MLEHRAAATELLGRHLERGELVHHRNGITGDNRPENLWVLGSQEHVRIHNAADLNIGMLTPVAMTFECGCRTWLKTEELIVPDREVLWAPCVLHQHFKPDSTYLTPSDYGREIAA